MIEPKMVESMFKFSGVNKEKLYLALIKIGNKYLRPPHKAKWTKKNPTLGYGYLISELLFYYIAPPGSKVMKMYVSKLKANHWFVQWPDSVLVDLGIEQFTETPPYGNAMEDPITEPPSPPVKVLAGLLGFTDDDIDE